MSGIVIMEAFDKGDTFSKLDYTAKVKPIKEISKKAELRQSSLSRVSVPDEYLEPEERSIISTLKNKSETARAVKYYNDFTKLSIQDNLVKWKGANVELLRDFLKLVDSNQLAPMKMWSIVTKDGRLFYVGMTLVFLSFLMFVFNSAI